MSLEAWQIELRRQFGRKQKFKVKNLGEQPLFSDFQVSNPASKREYRVSIRGEQPGDNFCSCPDFTTNTLGTCKHIEYPLSWLGRQRGGARALRSGFRPDYSEVHLRYGAKREVSLRPAQSVPTEFAELAAKFFDEQGTLKPSAYSRDSSTFFPKRRTSIIRCAATKTCWHLSPNCAIAKVAPAAGRNLPARNPQPRVRQTRPRAAV